MYCEVVQKKLAFYVEGVLDLRETKAVEAHLAACALCQDLLAQERAFLLQLRCQLTTPPAPPHVRSGIQSLLYKRQRSRRVLLWLLPASLVTLALIVFLGDDDGGPHLDWMVQSHLAVSNHPDFLDIRSDTPSVLGAWTFKKTGLQVPIAVPLPADIQLYGGKVADQDKRIVQIAFSSDQGSSSLYMMPKAALSARGASVDLKHVRFYPQREKDHVLVAWEDAKAGYVLVSRTVDGINRGCLLCHSDSQAKLPASAFSMGQI